MKTPCSALMLMIFLAAAGCAGFRSGLASIPYVGEVEPAPAPPVTTYELYKLKEIQLPGVKLDISLNNTIRTSDLQTMLFVVPMSFDPRDKPSLGENDRLMVRLTIIPDDSGFVFDPSGVTVTVDEQAFHPTTTMLVNAAKLHAYLKSTSGHRYDPSLSSDLVDEKIVLIKDKSYSLYIIFDCPVPTPGRVIRLDIGRALLHPKLPDIPTIRFMKIRWKEGYT